jgi:hypothetical protein
MTCEGHGLAENGRGLPILNQLKGEMMNQSSDFDPIDQLDRRPSEPSVRLRDSTFAKTRRVLRGRRMLRRGVVLAAFAAVYLAGLASMDVWRIVARREGLEQKTAKTNQHMEPSERGGNRSAVPNVGLPGALADQPAPGRPAKTRFEIMREAADRSWEQSGDIALATRLYARALRNASSAELVVSVDDNWLLMGLKEARIKEVKHANDRVKS